MAGRIRSVSYWNDTAPASNFPTLGGEIEADVAIVGGGIVGVTTAWRLRERGLDVVLLEARRVGEEVTGKSTAKITSQHNIKYTVIEQKFGPECARHYADANQAGLETIATLAEGLGIDCSLERRPAFTYTREDRHVAAIEKEAALARTLGLPASLTRDIGLPFEVTAAMRWDDQAQFHPVRYVKGLAAAAAGKGVRIFENSRVVDWSAHEVVTGSGRVKARHVVMATHLPLGTTGFFFAENYPHMHPVIMGRCESGRAPPGMYISVETPRHSVRAHRDEDGADWLILTGPSWKHGHVDQERESFAEIERFARETFGMTPEYRWTNEDYTPMDHAPFVGWSSSGPGACLVATGFDAWGITMGTASAMLLADIVTERENPWLELFDARRVKPLAGGKEFVKGNAEVATHLVGGWLSSKPRSYDDLKPGEAAILRIDGHNVAASRDGDGRLHAVSAVCTHMGCLVGWNENDRTWDCPCHGSRFEADGAVIHGPAVTALAPVEERSEERETNLEPGLAT